jgi:hypothetical protein
MDFGATTWFFPPKNRKQGNCLKPTDYIILLAGSNFVTIAKLWLLARTYRMVLFCSSDLVSMITLVTKFLSSLSMCN